MSWYRTGTVSVTNGSKTVTGVGTLWTTAVNAGDAFALVDANLNPTGAWYEVEAVVSNTEITLKQTYAGTTGSNKQYCVFNLVGNMTTPSFAQRLATFFASFQTLLDKPTSTPTALGIPVADENGNIADGWISKALLESNDAMVFKGTLGTGGTVTALPTSDYIRGWTYKVITAGTYAGLTCAIGDLIVAISSFDTEFQNSDWVLVPVSDEMTLKADIAYVDAELALKANITDVDDALALKADSADVADALALKADAADVMNALESSVNENIPIFDGVTGDKLKDSGVKLSDKADVDDVADALALKAPLASPTFTGDVIVPDQTAGNNSTKAANTKYVDAGLALKANITDVDDALALKADVDDVANALALKADITALETEKKLLMDEIDSLKKASIENSNAPYLTVSDYGDVTLAKNSVGVGTVGVDGVTVENLMTNGNFSNGMTGWEAYNAAISLANNMVKIQYSALYGELRQFKPFLEIGHKYYIKTVIITDSPVGGIRLVVGNTNGLAYIELDSSVAQAGSQVLSGIVVVTSQAANAFFAIKNYNTSTAYTTYVDMDYGVIQLDLTAHGLDSLTVSQVDALVAAGYFDGEKTFSGVGCLVSKDSTEAETGRMYFATDPMYSNATAKDVLAYDGGKYYHTHNVDSDGNAIAEPYDTEVDTNGQIVCLSEGTVTYEPWYPDIGIYTDKFTLTKAITAVKELYKYGSETPITDAVIAEDGLSFTSASLTAGDLAYGVFEFDEPLRPLMTIKSRNDVTTSVDTSTGTVYTFRPVVTDGVIVSWELTEV